MIRPRVRLKPDPPAWGGAADHAYAEAHTYRQAGFSRRGG